MMNEKKKEKEGGKGAAAAFGEDALFCFHLQWCLACARSECETLQKPFPHRETISKLLDSIIYTLKSDKDFILHYTHLKLDSEHNKVSKHILKLVYKSNPNNSNKFC